MVEGGRGQWREGEGNGWVERSRGKKEIGRERERGGGAKGRDEDMTSDG